VEVDVDLAACDLVALVDQGGERHDAGVVDEHGERAEPALHRIEERCEGRPVGDVEIEPHHVTSERGRRRPGFVSVDVADRHASAALSERGGRRTTDAPGASGDGDRTPAQGPRLS
jgi:hypothetical protein